MLTSAASRKELLRQIEVIRAQLQRLDAQQEQGEVAVDPATGTPLQAVESAPLACIEWDQERRVCRWSPHAVTLFGWSEDDVLGKRWDELGLVLPDDLPRVQPISERLLEGGVETNTSVNRNYRRDGRVIHCRWMNSVVRDEQGQVASMLSLVQEVPSSSAPGGKTEEVAGPLTHPSLAGIVGDVLTAIGRKQGEDLLAALVEQLAKSLGVTHVNLARVETAGDTASTVAFWNDGRHAPSSRYGLVGTPSREVLTHRVYVCSSGLQDRFPTDAALAEMNVDSYAGVSLLDSTGATIGLLAAMDRQSMEGRPELIAVLHWCADRVASELERMSVERALRASESMYRGLFEMAPNAIFVIREDTIAFANPAAQKLLHVDSFSMLQDRKLTEFVIADQRDRLASYLRHSSEKQSEAIELRIACENAERIEIEFRASTIDLDGAPAVLGMAVDITERKRMENALRRTQQSIDNNVTGVLWIQPSGEIRYANQAVCRLLGYELDQLLRMRTVDLTEDPDEQLEADFWRRVRDEGAVQMEAPLKSKSGELIASRLTGTYGRFEEEEWVFAFIDDLREEKQAQQALRESREQYQRLIENMSDVVYRVELRPQMHVKYVSSAIEGMLGYSAEEIYDDPERIPQLLHSGDRQTEAEIAAGSADDERVVRCFHRDGCTVWIEPRSKPVFDERGELIAVEGIARDVTRRREAEIAEQKMESRLTEVQRIAGVGQFTWEVESGEITWSDSLFHVFGYSHDEKLDYERIQREIHDTEDLPMINRWLSECLESDSTVLTPKEYRVRHRSGNEMHVRTAGVVERVEGKAVRLFGTVQNITRRKQAEIALRTANEQLEENRRHLERQVERRTVELSEAIEQLAENERVLSAILDNTSLMLGLCSPDGVILRANRAACESIGKEAAALVGRPIWESTEWPVEVRETLRGIFERAATGEFQRQELPRIHQGGQVSVLDFSVSAAFDSEGNLQYLIPEGRDITAQKAAERQLRFAQTSTDNSIDAVYWIDRHGQIAYVNDAACRHLGYSRDELLGKTLIDIDSSPEDEVMARRDQVLELGSLTFESEHRRDDGSTFPVSIAVRRLNYESEPYIIAFVRDITESKKREQELVRAKENAEAADRLKTAFLATMSHELRTPLNSVIGFTGILLDGISGELNDEQRKQLGMVERSAEHLLSLINDVLDISKIEAGQCELYVEPFDAAEVIRQAAASIHPQAQAAGLRFDVELPESIPVETDPLRLQQILLNLLKNAVKFTPHGSVSLLAGCRAEQLEVTIRDTGVGIRAEDLERVFLPFQQLDSGLDRRHEGPGLGLSIAQRLAELLGGRIEISSQVGEGSEFKVILPGRCD